MTYHKNILSKIISQITTYISIIALNSCNTDFSSIATKAKENKYYTKKGYTVTIHENNTATVEHNNGIFSKKETVPIICQANKNLLEIIGTLNPQNINSNSNKIHYTQNHSNNFIFLGQLQLYGGGKGGKKKIEYKNEDGTCPKGFSKEECKHKDRPQDKNTKTQIDSPKDQVGMNNNEGH